jgi:hypothetical protein
MSQDASRFEQLERHILEELYKQRSPDRVNLHTLWRTAGVTAAEFRNAWEMLEQGGLVNGNLQGPPTAVLGLGEITLEGRKALKGEATVIQQMEAMSKRLADIEKRLDKMEGKREPH